MENTFATPSFKGREQRFNIPLLQCWTNPKHFCGTSFLCRTSNCSVNYLGFPIFLVKIECDEYWGQCFLTIACLTLCCVLVPLPCQECLTHSTNILGYILLSGPLLGRTGLLGTILLLVVHRIPTYTLYFCSPLSLTTYKKSSHLSHIILYMLIITMHKYKRKSSL